MRPIAYAALLLGLAGCGADAPAPVAGTMPAAVNLCISCHGRDGRAVVDGYPHIGGQNERYLLSQLRHFRSGKRDNAAMRAVMGALDDDDLAALAGWYASRDPCNADE